MKFTAFAAATAFAFAIASPVLGQEIPTQIITIYRAAPGEQANLLKWIAGNDAAAKQAGVSASQLYVHQNGASWDFLIVSPATTPEQDKAVDAAAVKLGVTVGPKAGLEMRSHVAEHTDTFVAGPTTAADWLKRLGQ